MALISPDVEESFTHGILSLDVETARATNIDFVKILLEDDDEDPLWNGTELILYGLGDANAQGSEGAATE